MPRFDTKTGLKVCSKCRISRTRSFYAQNIATADGLNYQCNVCVQQYRMAHSKRIKAYAKRYSYEGRYTRRAKAKNHRVQHLAAHREYEKEHRQKSKARGLREAQLSYARRVSMERRARKSNAPNDGTITKSALKALDATWTGVCPFCLRLALPTYDHIVALVKGGHESLLNLQLMCRSCNSSKRDQDMEVWLRRVKER